jgi:hypothetical protein
VRRAARLAQRALLQLQSLAQLAHEDAVHERAQRRLCISVRYGSARVARAAGSPARARATRVSQLAAATATAAAAAAAARQQQERRAGAVPATGTRPGSDGRRALQLRRRAATQLQR